MDIEIHTTTGTWLTRVNPRDFTDLAPGALAAHVSGQIQQGLPLEVRLQAEAGAAPLRQTPAYVAVFNPGNVVCVAEAARRSRRL